LTTSTSGTPSSTHCGISSERAAALVLRWRAYVVVVDAVAVLPLQWHRLTQ
jgi:hypothetical protein